MTTTRATTAALSVLFALPIAGCASASSSGAPVMGNVPALLVEDEAQLVDVPAPALETDPAPEVETDPEPEPEVVGDEWSQVIDGTLYQGTEKAPVRIGTDTPGQVPAADATAETVGWDEAAQAADKYLVLIDVVYTNRVTKEGYDGWIYRVFGVNRFGNYRAVSSSWHYGPNYSSREEVLAAAKVVDGRELDRAEYILLARQDD